MAKKPRHVPQRTCVGCRQVKDKNQLIRVVRRPTGEIELDLTGRVSGRGAYICPLADCLKTALKGQRLDRALGKSIGEDVAASLAQQLPQ